MCSVPYVHVEAGKWGAGGALSNVDMVINMCIKRRTLVCSPACNRGMNGTGRGGVGWGVMLFYLFFIEEPKTKA